MSTQDIIYYDIALEGNRILKPGEPYQFRLLVNSITVNGLSMTYLSNVKVFLGNRLYSIDVNREVPCNVSGSLLPPDRIGSWYPRILVEGLDQLGYLEQIPFSYSRPIISTFHFPVYDARLGRSNWTLDEYKIMQIKNILNGYGFDCTTIGKEVKSSSTKGKEFLNFEKGWASGGDCFISILTPRDLRGDGKLSLPAPWVTTEAGLSYSSDRPQLVFIEEGVDRVALYGHIDNDHIIQFFEVDNRVYLEGDFSKKITHFRKECQNHQTNRSFVGVGHLIFLGFALFGGYKFLEGLFDK
jgi:hypothetical protein